MDVTILRAPFELDSDNRTVVMQLNSIRYQFNLALGQYINATGTQVSGVLAFLTELRDAVFVASGGVSDWSFTPHDADGSGYYSGVRMQATNPTDTIYWDFDDAAFTLDPRLLGYKEGATTADSQAQSSAGELLSEVSIRYAWRLRTATGPELKDGRSFIRRYSNVSDERPDRANAFIWSESKRRNFLARYVPAALIFGQRATNETQAGLGYLNDGDQNQGLFDIWYQCAPLTTFEAIYDVEASSGFSLNPLTIAASSERVRLNDKRQQEDFEALTTLATNGGEYYHLNLKLAVVEGNYDY